jgi:hypothetical protein
VAQVEQRHLREAAAHRDAQDAEVAGLGEKHAAAEGKFGY